MLPISTELAAVRQPWCGDAIPKKREPPLEPPSSFLQLALILQGWPKIQPVQWVERRATRKVAAEEQWQFLPVGPAPYAAVTPRTAG